METLCKWKVALFKIVWYKRNKFRKNLINCHFVYNYSLFSVIYQRSVISNIKLGILFTIVKLKIVKRVFYMIKLDKNKRTAQDSVVRKMTQLQRPCFADFWRVGLWDNPLLTHSLYPFPPYHPDNKYNIRSLRNQLLILLQLLLIPPPSFSFQCFFSYFSSHL